MNVKILTVSDETVKLIENFALTAQVAINDFWMPVAVMVVIFDVEITRIFLKYLGVM